VRRGAWRERQSDLLDDENVLSNGEGVVAEGLSIPTRHAGKPVRNVRDLDVIGRWIEEVEPAA